MINVLIIDDEKLILWGLKRDLERVGYKVFAYQKAEEAFEIIEKQHFHAALVDVRLPGIHGLQMLEKIKTVDPETQVIMITAFADVEVAVDSIRRGAFDFILKPFTLDKIHLTIQNAFEATRLKKEVATLKRELAQRQKHHLLLGKSPRMKPILESIERIGRAGAGVVLICGESGTGKGVAANDLHAIGPRANGPFIEINCGAIPESLFESELFGHEKGAFTGASEQKKGLMELADGGTIFLDEVGEMPMPMQSKLLKALEEQKIRRVGGQRPIQLDVNIIAATNRDLATAVREGSFREDLFYRLNVVPIFLPALRERDNDILLLAEHFLENYKNRYKRTFTGFSDTASKRMLAYSWPGNIRELRNSVERAVILETGDLIEDASLGIGLGVALPATNTLVPPSDGRVVDLAPIPNSGMDLQLHLENVERHFLQEAMTRCGGNQSQTAKMLGMTRDILRYRLKKYGLGEN
ncbi:MAG: sigma-54-dependent Fis family transcriptional regulator [Candidatus Riflebacteria bacterium]|nr:sigma-54-dependent Fis family transcriptional regulator [Candidatus Riflebacteria bacterium]